MIRGHRGAQRKSNKRSREAEDDKQDPVIIREELARSMAVPFAFHRFFSQSKSVGRFPNLSLSFQGQLQKKAAVTFCILQPTHGVLCLSLFITLCLLQKYRNTKVKVHSPDGDTEYFDIVAGVLQGDTLAPYLFIICLDYVLRTSIDKIRENGFELTKRRSKRYPVKTITDADYADDLAILANTPNQAETLLHSLERAAAGIGLHVNAKKN